MMKWNRQNRRRKCGAENLCRTFLMFKLDYKRNDKKYITMFYTEQKSSVFSAA